MIWGANSQYDTGARDIEINMGYYDKSQKKFYLTLEALGEYQFSEIEVVTHSMDNVEKNIIQKERNMLLKRFKSVEIRLPVKLK